ncbi:hypothetical protein ACU686_15580 [Yinghuangia aomiensis]
MVVAPRDFANQPRGCSTRSASCRNGFLHKKPRRIRRGDLETFWPSRQRPQWSLSPRPARMPPTCPVGADKEGVIASTSSAEMLDALLAVRRLGRPVAGVHALLRRYGGGEALLPPGIASAGRRKAWASGCTT